MTAWSTLSVFLLFSVQSRVEKYLSGCRGHRIHVVLPLTELRVGCFDLGRKSRQDSIRRLWQEGCRDLEFGYRNSVLRRRSRWVCWSFIRCSSVSTHLTHPYRSNESGGSVSLHTAREKPESGVMIQHIKSRAGTTRATEQIRCVQPRQSKRWPEERRRTAC